MYKGQHASLEYANHVLRCALANMKIMCGTKSVVCEVASLHIQFSIISLDLLVGFSFGGCFDPQDCVLDKRVDFCILCLTNDCGWPGYFKSATIVWSCYEHEGQLLLENSLN